MLTYCSRRCLGWLLLGFSTRFWVPNARNLKEVSGCCLASPQKLGGSSFLSFCPWESNQYTALPPGSHVIIRRGTRSLPRWEGKGKTKTAPTRHDHSSRGPGLGFAAALRSRSRRSSSIRRLYRCSSAPASAPGWRRPGVCHRPTSPRPPPSNAVLAVLRCKVDPRPPGRSDVVLVATGNNSISF